MTARQPRLRAQAAEFAGRISELLNRTVTDGIRVVVVLQDDDRVGMVGYGIHPRSAFPGKGIPLRIGAGPVRSYLHVMHTLVQEHGFLVTDKSSFGLYLDERLDSCVLHYDYERDPSNRYPAAHVQVEATSPAFEELCRRLGRRSELGRLHIPVGGKRFRPCLEDLVEMLIVEELALGRPGWEAAIEEHRGHFRRIQLKAAVRDDLEAAREKLERFETEQGSKIVGAYRRLRRPR